MVKRKKLETPEWIKKGYGSEDEYLESSIEKPAKKSSSKKTYKIRICPVCKSDDVKVVVGEEAKGLWFCNGCKWKGKGIEEKIVSEEEFLSYLEKKEEIHDE